MRFKLALLVLCTAFVSFACASTSQSSRATSATAFTSSPAETGTTAGRSHKPIMLQHTELVLRGQCVAKLTFDEKTGDLINMATDPPCRATEDHLLVNGLPILDLSGSITFGSGTKYCRVVGGKQVCVCKDTAC